MERVITRWLAVSGVIPFALCSALIVLNWHTRLALYGLLIYAAVILSFFALIHFALGFSHRIPRWFLLLSIVPPVFAWIVFLLPSSMLAVMHETWQCLFMAICFSLFFAIDAWGFSKNHIDKWFFTLRTGATMLAIASLGLAAWSLPLE
jgi:hypothetical protein